MFGSLFSIQFLPLMSSFYLLSLLLIDLIPGIYSVGRVAPVLVAHHLVVLTLALTNSDIYSQGRRQEAKRSSPLNQLRPPKNRSNRETIFEHTPP